jgi:hypothetical protein
MQIGDVLASRRSSMTPEASCIFTRTSQSITSDKLSAGTLTRADQKKLIDAP